MLNIHLGLLFIFKTSPRHSSPAAGFSFFDSPRRREAAIVHCQISLIEINASSSLPHVFCSVAATRPGLGAKRWRQLLTIGNGPKSASSGRAKPLTKASASNTPALAEFGLSMLRGLSFGPAQSRRQIQKSPNTTQRRACAVP